TKIFQGTPDNVAWMIDLELDRDGHPYVLFSCQSMGEACRAVRVAWTCGITTRAGTALPGIARKSLTRAGACILAKTIIRVWAHSTPRIRTSFTFRPTPIR